MPDATTSASDLRRSGTRLVGLGLVGVLAVLLGAALLLFLYLPDANTFNARVEQIFIENDDLTTQAEIKLLEILAQSGTAFQDVLQSYRVVIFILLLFATALLIAALVFLGQLVAMSRRVAQIEQAGIQVSSLLVSREEKTVYLNNMGFKLTDAQMETFAVLAEARLDDDVLTGAQIEAILSGRNEGDVEEAAGATRIKRLRDGLGNQMVSALLIKNISKRGYMLAVAKEAIKVI